MNSTVHKPTLKAGKPAILRKTMGSKLIKMTFTDQAQAGKSVQVVDVDEAARKQFSIERCRSGRVWRDMR